jgi:quinol monooxygenase YgiN
MGMSYAVVSVHSPRPEHRAAVLDSMQRYSRVAREQPGLLWTGVVDDDSARFVGIAVWESAEAARAASPALMAEVGDDPFTTWDAAPIDSLRGVVR